jgi:hypothetical protein
MAIAPNTTFSSGAILTAAQMNALPFGTMQYSSKTTSDSPITTIATQITMSSFTAIASRNYKITYFEPVMFCSSGSGEMVLTIKNTTASTTIATASTIVNVTTSSNGMLQFITTFSAGAVVLSGSLTYSGTGFATSSRSSTRTAFMLVEDIGPA